MIKKISIDQLEPGMYIHDLNCGWIDHPFFKSRFRIDNEKQLLKIRGVGVRELYIDTDRGGDVAVEAPTAVEVVQELDRELAAIIGSQPRDDGPLSRAQEWASARRVQQEANQVISGIMDDVRLGLLVDSERVMPVVDAIMNSVVRNQNALFGLTRIRQMGRYTFEHSVNVAVLLIAFAHALEMDAATIRDIGVGGLLHDLGKVRIPPAIHDKPDRLTDEEFAIMREHVAHTRNLLASMPDIPAIALEVAAEHHERYDGSGYPERKRGAQISRHGQMVGIVDVYDAITSDRVYHKGESPHVALRRLLEWSRHHFDPQLVQRFVQCVGVYPVGSLVRLESGRLGVVVESNHADRLQPVVRVVLDIRRRTYLTPHDVDLSRQRGARRDRIVGIEAPDQWPVSPEEILSQVS